MKILFVCLGNICRSPLAEGIMKSKVKQLNLDWTIESAGTSGFHMGDAPDERSIKVAKKHKIDISHQTSRRIRSIDFKEFDFLYAMDSSNYKELMNQAEEFEKKKIKLILNELYPNENRGVPDPYYGGEDGFEDLYHMLDKVCDAIISKLNSNI